MSAKESPANAMTKYLAGGCVHAMMESLGQVGRAGREAEKSAAGPVHLMCVDGGGCGRLAPRRGR